MVALRVDLLDGGTGVHVIGIAPRLDAGEIPEIHTYSGWYAHDSHHNEQHDHSDNRQHNTQGDDPETAQHVVSLYAIINVTAVPHKPLPLYPF